MQVIVKRSCRRVEYYNTVVAGMAFFLIFVGSGTVQNYESTVQQNTGRLGLALIYGTFCLSSLFAAPLHALLGNRPSLLVGGVFYVLNLLANVPGGWLFLVSCALVGTAATLVWTAQGVFISRQAATAGPGAFGLLSGVFFAIFQANGVVGNLLAQAFASTGLGLTLSTVILSAVCACGVLLFLLLVYPIDDSRRDAVNHSEELEQLIDISGDEEPPEQSSVRRCLEACSATSLALVLHADFGHLLPLIAYAGASKAFIFGSIPPLFGQRLIGWGMSCFALTNVAGSLLFGRLSDACGRRVVLAAAGVLAACGVGAANVTAAPLYVLFIAAGCMGLSDAAFTNLLFGLVVTYSQRSDSPPAKGFGYLQLCRTFFTAVAFAYSVYLTVLQLSTVLLGLLALGLLYLTYYQCFLGSIELTTPPNNNNNNNNDDDDDDDDEVNT